MDDKIKRAADTLYDLEFHSLMEARGEDLRSALSDIQNGGMDIGSSGIAFRRIRKVHVDFVGKDMSARLTSFQQGFGQANVVPTADDFAEIWSIVEDVYRRGLRSVAEILRRHRQQGRVGIARVDEDSGDVARHHDRVLREFKVWRSQVELHASKRISADDQATPEAKLHRWTGGAQYLTVAIVFTDIVGSTPLGIESGDAAWKEIRQGHLVHVNDLIQRQGGILIKNSGDGVLTLFHNSLDAIRFAVVLLGDTGHPKIRVRVGIHVGQVSVEDNDVSGQEVNFAQRVMSAGEEGGLTVSPRVKEDFEKLGKVDVFNLRWVERRNVILKSFDAPVTLWRVEGVSD